MCGALLGCGTAGEESPVEGKKVAYIMQMEESDIFTAWSEAAEATAKALGMEYEAVFCNGSDEEWRKQVENCAANGYDGLLLSHGGKDYAYTFLKDICERYPDLKIVTFDTQFEDENGETKTIDGVTQFFQQDAEMSRLLLDYICNTVYGEKTAAGDKVNILKIWKGPGYIAAFDRREVGYVEFEENGLIRTVETIAPQDVVNAEADMERIAEAALAAYEEGEIDAIWCCYDLYARGVYRVLKEKGYEIPMVSIDICDADIAMMAEDGSGWYACATTNWNFNGEFGIRALALEMTGEYDKIIDPMTGTASAWLELPPKLITRDMVAGSGEPMTFAELQKQITAGKDSPTWMLTADWME